MRRLNININENYLSMLRISSFLLVISLFAVSSVAQNKATKEYRFTKLIVGGHVLDPSVLTHNLSGKFRSGENTISLSSGSSLLDPSEAPKTIRYKIYTGSTSGTPVTTYTLYFDDEHNDPVSQIPNADFETWNDDGTLPYPWHTYKDAQITADGIDRSTLPAVERVEGRNGGYAVKITSNGNKVNGNLTTGIINIGSTDFSSTSNYNFTDRAITDGNVPIIGAPDEFECYVKMKCGDGNTEGGKISIIVHGEKPFRDPGTTYDDVKLSSFSKVIPACDGWTKVSGPFEHTKYKISDSNDKCYILFTATTNPTPGGSSGDELIIDDIKLIYYHGLSDIKVNNVSITEFDPNTTNYVVNGYSVNDLISRITYTTKGKGSKVAKSKTDSAVILTVTAPDGDVAKYTITANTPSKQLTGITFLDGDKKVTEVEITAGKYEYTVNATYGGVAKITTKDLNATTEESYDKENGKYTITVKPYNYDITGFSNTYNFQFNLPPAPLSYATVDGHTFLFGKETTVKATGVCKSGTVSAFHSDDKVDVSLKSSCSANKLKLTLALSAGDTYSSKSYTITYANEKKTPAYQIPNSNFEDWIDDNTLTEGWNSFNNATGTLQAFASASPKVTKVEGSEAYDGASVKLVSKNVMGIAAANGNLTTGAINMGSTDPADAANYNFTDFAMKETNQPIKAQPDAFEVMAKYKAGTLVDANSGVALQARVQAIIHGPVDYQDPEIVDQADSKVALANVYIGKDGDVTEWAKFTGDFEYTTNTADNLYILVSATTNPTPGASYDDELYLDNFKLIYYHELSDIRVDGVTIPNFNSKKTSYIVNGDVKTIYKALSYATNGKSASVTKSIDGDVINITVTAADGEGSTKYTITANEPSSLLSGVTFSDSDWNEVKVEINDEQKEYKVDAMYDSVSEITTKDLNATTSEEYDEKTGICTIIVTSSDYNQETSTGSQTTYKFQFNLPSAPLSYATVDGHTFYFTNKGDNINASGVYMGGSVTGYYSDEDVNVSINTSYADNVLTLALSADDTYSPKSYTITYANEKKTPAYQIPNSDFESWIDDNTLAESWNSFNNATGTLQAFASASPKITKVEGSEAYDGASVKLVSKNVMGIAAANGNLTTGAINMGSINAADAANYNFTDFAMKETNQPLAALPDAFEVMAKYKAGTLVDANSGVALQARVQAIIHGPVNYQDPEIPDQADSKVALANVYIGKEGDVTEWTKFTGDFEYTTNTAKDLYILVSATTNPTPGASYDDELYLDNFKLIYYHELSDIRVDGVTIPNFNSDQTEYTLDGNVQDIYDALTYTIKGHAVTAEKAIIGSTITITVTAADGGQTIYTLNTNATAISHISFDEALTHEVYTLTGIKVARPSHPGLYIVDGQKTLIK